MILREGLDTSVTGSNFNHVDFWTYTGVKDKGVYSADWGAITKFQPLGKVELQYLYSIQPDDSFESGFTREQKMNWLIGNATGSPPSRPYWTFGDSWQGNWKKFQFGTMVFGHSKIRVHTNPDGSVKIWVFKTEYKNGSNWEVGELEFCKVDGFKPYMMNTNKFPVQWLVENGYIQQATAAHPFPRQNSIDYYPRGKMYHPVWDPDFWPSNYGNNLYIAKDFLIL